MYLVSITRFCFTRRELGWWNGGSVTKSKNVLASRASLSHGFERHLRSIILFTSCFKITGRQIAPLFACTHRTWRNSTSCICIDTAQWPLTRVFRSLCRSTSLHSLRYVVKFGGCKFCGENNDKSLVSYHCVLIWLPGLHTPQELRWVRKSPVKLFYRRPEQIIVKVKAL